MSKTHIKDLTLGTDGTALMDFPNTDGTADQVLTTDGAGNVTFQDIPTPSLAMNDLSNMTETNLAVLDWMYYNGAGWANISVLGAAALIGGNTALGNLSNVTAASPSTNDVLQWNGSAWVNATVATGTPDLDDVLNETTGNSTSQALTTGAFKATSININSAFIFPTADGTADQVLKTDGSGVVTWEDEGGNPEYQWEMSCYNPVTTSEDTDYWYPGSEERGFRAETNWNDSSLPTTGRWNMYKKMSHRIPMVGKWDLTCTVDVSMSDADTGTSHCLDYSGGDITVTLYKVAKSGTVGTVALTSLASATNTQSSTHTAYPTTTTLTTTGTVLGPDDRLLVVLKGTESLTGTRYCHWAYDLNAEKTF